MDGTGWEEGQGWRYFRSQAAECHSEASSHGRHSSLALKDAAGTAREILRMSRADKWTAVLTSADGKALGISTLVLGQTYASFRMKASQGGSHTQAQIQMDRDSIW